MKLGGNENESVEPEPVRAGVLAGHFFGHMGARLLRTGFYRNIGSDSQYVLNKVDSSLKKSF